MSVPDRAAALLLLLRHTLRGYMRSCAAARRHLDDNSIAGLVGNAFLGLIALETLCVRGRVRAPHLPVCRTALCATRASEATPAQHTEVQQDFFNLELRVFWTGDTDYVVRVYHAWCAPT